jgi:hypothetical protein
MYEPSFYPEKAAAAVAEAAAVVAATVGGVLSWVGARRVLVNDHSP